MAPSAPRSAIVAALLVAQVFSLAAPGPAATQLKELDGRGWTPKPTDGPDLGIGKRVPPGSYQSSNLFSSTNVAGVAFGQICGYEFGVPISPFGCVPGLQCGTDTIKSVVGCCAYPLASCTLQTKCVDYGTPKTNENIYTCNNEYPYCKTDYYPNGYSYFICAKTQEASASIFYSSKPDSFYAKQSKLQKLSSLLSQSRSANQGKQSAAVVTVTTTESSSAGGSGAQGSTGGGGSKKNSGGDSTPIGAIVGGVIGGVAALAIIIFAIWFFLRQQKKKKKQQQTTNQTPQTGYPQSPQMGQPGAGGYGAQYPAAAAGAAAYPAGQTYENKSPTMQYAPAQQGYPMQYAQMQQQSNYPVPTGSPPPQGQYSPPQQQFYPYPPSSTSPGQYQSGYMAPTPQTATSTSPSQSYAQEASADPIASPAGTEATELPTERH